MTFRLISIQNYLTFSLEIKTVLQNKMYRHCMIGINLLGLLNMLSQTSPFSPSENSNVLIPFSHFIQLFNSILFVIYKLSAGQRLKLHTKLLSFAWGMNVLSREVAGTRR